METDDVSAEPAVDRWSESKPSRGERASAAPEVPFFRLSGGLMRSSSKTSNRIDGLLTRLMEHPSSCGYRSSLDGNLDYLLTSLQLDMIGMVANNYSESYEQDAEEEPAPDPAEREPQEE